MNGASVGGAADLVAAGGSTKQNVIPEVERIFSFLFGKGLITGNNSMQHAF
jgi:hypothetical protein